MNVIYFSVRSDITLHSSLIQDLCFEIKDKFHNQDELQKSFKRASLSALEEIKLIATKTINSSNFYCHKVQKENSFVTFTGGAVFLSETCNEESTNFLEETDTTPLTRELKSTSADIHWGLGIKGRAGKFYELKGKKDIFDHFIHTLTIDGKSVNHDLVEEDCHLIVFD